MDVKLIDVRAPGTQASVLAVRLEAAARTDAAILTREGFSGDYLFVATVKSEPNYITYDKFHWRNGTGGVARNTMMYLVHDELEKRWDELSSGDTLDLTSRWPEFRDIPS